jgi:hypothetical protein
LIYRDRALALIALQIPVFKVRVDAQGVKTPLHENGHLDATLDPGLADDWFTENPRAQVGAYMGAAGLIALDVDMKNGKDGWSSLDSEWLEVPETHGYDTPSGGRHLIYSAPEGVNLAPSANYRGMEGVDIRGGSSWVLWNGDVPASRDAFAPAPTWMLDERSVKSATEFQGDVKAWFDSLEPGEPNALVRRAIERVEPDMSHSDMVAATYEAIRLGAEGNSGVPTLLEALEEAWISRDPGNHTTPEDRWEYKFHEALNSGITRYGDAIDLRKNLPAYSPSIVPAAVPDRLITGAPGDKAVFRELLATAAPLVDDDLVLTSILWNSPRTKDISREWGLSFVHKRVQDYRVTPEPVKENPSLAKAVVAPNGDTKGTEFLTVEERMVAERQHTFIQTYRAATDTKGFTNETYAVPCAWTALSMTFGRRAFIPLAKTLEVNIWALVLGESTTGKGTEERFLREVLDMLFGDEDTHHYNLGAMSSPDGIHLGLLQRDRKPSIISNDEASDFFRDIRTKDWMAPLPDKLAKNYDGYVEPSSKISLKELKGKSAFTSLNMLMWATPDRILELLDASQFESGFLARANWVWDDTIPDPNRKSNLALQAERETEVPAGVYDLVGDLTHATREFPERFAVSATEEAQARLNQAADTFRAVARTSPRWSFVQRAVDRLVMETLWKCAALTALYRGDTEFELSDALVAISYGAQWLKTMMRVAESISESPYSRDLAEIEHWVSEEGGEVTRAALLHNFRGKVLRSRREIDDRIEFMVDSGRLLVLRDKDRGTVYKLNR